MADDSFSDDFDKLLDDFIATQLKDTEDTLAELDDTPQIQKDSSSASPDKSLPTDEQNNFEIDLSNIVNLPLEENRLFQAYQGFISAIAACAKNADVPVPEFTFSPEYITPRFRPSRTDELNSDIIKGWEILIKTNPTRLSSLPSNASDEQILSFAEKTTDSVLQNALISYVETLIEVEACEIAYNLRKIKYQKRQIEKKIYEDQLIRKEKTRKYIEAIRAKNFPINAEMLVNNFFKAARSDPENAKKVLENNPATFAPIQTDKLPAKLFGLIKPKPQDGYKINKKIGKFLKTLKA